MLNTTAIHLFLRTHYILRTCVFGIYVVCNGWWNRTIQFVLFRPHRLPRVSVVVRDHIIASTFTCSNQQLIHSMRHWMRRTRQMNGNYESVDITTKFNKLVQRDTHTETQRECAVHVCVAERRIVSTCSFDSTLFEDTMGFSLDSILLAHTPHCVVISTFTGSLCYGHSVNQSNTHHFFCSRFAEWNYFRNNVRTLA